MRALSLFDYMSAPVVRPILRRRHTGLTTEDHGEVALVAEPQQRGDLKDGAVAGDKKLLSDEEKLPVIVALRHDDRQRLFVLRHASR